MSVQYAIIEQSRVGDEQPYTQTPLTDPKPWQLRELIETCRKYNASLAAKGRKAAKLRDKPLHEATKEEAELVREWEHGGWTGDAPGKDKHYIVVSREVSAWVATDAPVPEATHGR